MGELEQRLVALIRDGGPIGFDEFQANALYAPGLGFYASGHGAGRRRDFLTSPEVGPLFGAVLARALDGWWEDLGRPPRFVVVEAGAGPGTLARSILAASPACAAALELVLVEVAVAQHATHPDAAASRADLPTREELGGGPVVVLANELLDNLPVALAERFGGRWWEVTVDIESDADPQLVFASRPLGPDQQAWCEHRAPQAKEGDRIPVQADAAAWVGEALDLAGDGGRVVVIDYARTTTAELAHLPMDAWLRTYAAHGRGGDPLEDPGAQDITCDVALDQLLAVATPASVRTQAEFLRDHGLWDLVEEGRRRWQELGIGGGLEAIGYRSRITEAPALTDPSGLGGFTVIEWSGRGPSA